MSNFATSSAAQLNAMRRKLARFQRRQRIGDRLTRSFDVLIAGTTLVVGFPAFALVGLAIYLSDPGPIFFQQIRIGQFGRPFYMLKFRSMYQDAEARKTELMQDNQHGSAGVTFKNETRSAHILVYGIIRRLSIDELPQILNILRGDMSIVGPRPAVVREVEQYTQQQRLRLLVKPGLTCYWQVKGRADIPFEEQVQLDLDYIL